MPDDQDTIQNPISEENPIPASSQEPVVDIPVETTPETGTAQILPNEPFSPEPVSVIVSNNNKVLELLAKAKLAVQFRKRKKLEK